MESDPHEVLDRELRACSSYIDGQVAALNARLDAMDKAAGVLHETITRAPTEVQQEVHHVREYFTAVLEEQRRGMLLAAQEREKAASALRIELERAITEGDRNLRDHITAQVEQIRAAFISAELLEVQRFDSLRREMELITSSASDAIEKAESANDKRFESVNEFRAQLADQSNRYMPREVADAQFDEMRRQIAEITVKLSAVVS